MTNPTNSGSQIHYGETNTQLKTQIFNYQLLLGMVYEICIYEINLNVVNTKYCTFNLNMFPLQFIILIGINHYLFDKVNEFELYMNRCLIHYQCE